VNILRGNQIARWEPQRAAAASTGASNPLSPVIPTTGAEDADHHAHVTEKQGTP
jgi:hypothetical protein